MLRVAGFTPLQLRAAWTEAEQRVDGDQMDRVRRALFGRGPYEFLEGATRNVTPFPNKLHAPVYRDELERHYHPCDYDLYDGGPGESAIDYPAAASDRWFFSVPQTIVVEYRDAQYDVAYDDDPLLLPQVDNEVWLIATGVHSTTPVQSVMVVAELIEHREASALLRFTTTLPLLRDGRADRATFEEALLKSLEH